MLLFLFYSSSNQEPRHLQLVGPDTKAFATPTTGLNWTPMMNLAFNIESGDKIVCPNLLDFIFFEEEEEEEYISTRHVHQG